MGIMDIYEVELCRRGRWEQQDARFVAARDADEAAYKVTGKHLHSEGERSKVRLRARRLGNGSHRRSCFTPPEAASAPPPSLTRSSAAIATLWAERMDQRRYRHRSSPLSRRW